MYQQENQIDNVPRIWVVVWKWPLNTKERGKNDKDIIDIWDEQSIVVKEIKSKDTLNFSESRFNKIRRRTPLCFRQCLWWRSFKSRSKFFLTKVVSFSCSASNYNSVWGWKSNLFCLWVNWLRKNTHYDGTCK